VFTTSLKITNTKKRLPKGPYFPMNKLTLIENVSSKFKKMTVFWIDPCSKLWKTLYSSSTLTQKQIPY